MSPTFPFFVQALAGCFWISASQTFTGNGHCQPASPSLLPNDVLGAILDDTLVWRLPHVEYGYSASSSRTVTSPGHPGPAGFHALKGTLASASISGHGGTTVTMSPTFPFLVQDKVRRYCVYLCHMPEGDVRMGLEEDGTPCKSLIHEGVCRRGRCRIV
ncbi:hypothetical protein HPB51_021385 [Rhipicephalus microplus]|uniref:Uncharacterized protein n=1 Tax=Rhipicephalus microplus TaxID=6941 RepID=A0A9J6F8W9_RHIMP|nr:hypothetical protein HPB51_021385 [Rhipicephalus microplus]